MASCAPFIHRGTPASVRLVAESTRTTRDTLHVAFTVRNRTSEELLVRLWAKGPLVEIRDGAGKARCVQLADGPQVFAGGEWAEYLRVARGSSVTLRRDLALDTLANCGPGHFTLSARTEVIRSGVPRPQSTVSQRVSLTIAPSPGAG